MYETGRTWRPQQMISAEPYLQSRVLNNMYEYLSCALATCTSRVLGGNWVRLAEQAVSWYLLLQLQPQTSLVLE